MAEIMKATGRQAHTVRGFVSILGKNRSENSSALRIGVLPIFCAHRAKAGRPPRDPRLRQNGHSLLGRVVGIISQAGPCASRSPASGNGGNAH